VHNNFKIPLKSFDSYRKLDCLLANVKIFKFLQDFMFWKIFWREEEEEEDQQFTRLSDDNERKLSDAEF
jgi:hypothetical protein